jgi:hypothetical protein
LGKGKFFEFFGDRAGILFVLRRAVNGALLEPDIKSGLPVSDQPAAEPYEFRAVPRSSATLQEAW